MRQWLVSETGLKIVTETTRHAHVILPPVSPLERSDIDIFGAVSVHNHARYNPSPRTCRAQRLRRGTRAIDGSLRTTKCSVDGDFAVQRCARCKADRLR